MSLLFIESLIVGFITLIIGTIILNVTQTEENKNKKNKQEKYKMAFIFFAIGMILHLLLESGGFNKWYCDKKCHTGYTIISRLN